MIFLADEGVDKPIVDLLRSSGFDVHYILETHSGSLGGATEILLFSGKLNFDRSKFQTIAYHRNGT